MPVMDAPMVERLRAAGAIPLARTNLPDLALRVHTDSALHGVTANPFDATKTAGGSSGGEAAAIACGMSPLGLGNDIGGSLRNPAYCCGITSLKPSLNRIPHAGSAGLQDQPLIVQLMAVDGPMARRVADVRQAFITTAGAHPRDPFAISAPFTGDPVSSPARVAIVPEPPGGSTSPDVVSAVRAAGAALADAGYDVVEATPPLVEDAVDTWLRWLMADITELLPVFRTVMSPVASRFLEVLAAMVDPIDVAGHMQLMMRRHEIARQWSEFFVDHPLIVGPVWAGPPFAAGWDVETEANAAATLELIRFVTPVNLLGLPAAAVPTGLADGLPTGVQVIGNRFREDLCLAAAEAIEARLGVLTPIEPAGR
jgi:amidase